MFWRALVMALVLGLLAACGGTGAPATEKAGQPVEAGTEAAEGELPGTGGTQAPGASQGPAYIAPSSEDCQKMAEDVQAALAAAEEAVAVEETAAFEDDITQETGIGCQVIVTGTGADFPDYESFVDMAGGLSVVLQSAGWNADPAYLADSPTATAFAVRRDTELALAHVEWQPAPEANCPQDQPISDCEVAPEQMNYTIRVNYAVRAR